MHKSVKDSTNFLVWAGLRHSIPHSLRSSTYNVAIRPLQLILEDNIFDVSKKKSKEYYKALVGRKAQFPKSINKLQNNFNLLLQQLTQSFQLPHTVALEPYVKAFQYKVLNGILYTNSKLYQIGYIQQAISVPNEPGRQSRFIIFFYFLVHFHRIFGPILNLFGTYSQIKKIQLSLQDIIVGVVTTKCPSHHLLNYMLLIGKLYLWVCRANKTPPKIFYSP